MIYAARETALLDRIVIDMVDTERMTPLGDIDDFTGQVGFCFSRDVDAIVC
jgi:hypothetical protein